MHPSRLRLLFLLALLAGCGYTTIDNVWREPGAIAPRKRIAVVGITHDELLKRLGSYVVRIGAQQERAAAEAEHEVVCGLHLEVARAP